MLGHFEVHITGDESILEHAKTLQLNTIVIDLLKPDKSVLRTEYMTSHIFQFNNYDECKCYVDQLVDLLEKKNVNIYRVKIECPYFQKYVDQSCYFEAHYYTTSNLNPLSVTKGKNRYLATEREYDKSKYANLFSETTYLQGLTLELCLYDNNVEEDKDWFDLYEI